MVSKNAKVAGGVALLALTFAFIPMLSAGRMPSLVNRADKLTGSQRQRGMFTSVGRDAGRDPDWDLADNTWKGKRNSLKRGTDQE